MRAFFLFVLRGLMEVLWLYAWASFVGLECCDLSFKIPSLIFVFFVGAFWERLLKGRNCRVISYIALHMIGCTLAILAVFWSIFHGGSFPGGLFSLYDMPATGHAPSIWIRMIFAGMVSLLSWIRGIQLSGCLEDIEAARAAFNRGIIALITLFLIKFAVTARWGHVFTDNVDGRFVILMVIIGIATLVLARNDNLLIDGFKKGLLGLGTIMGFSIVCLSIAAVPNYLFLPELRGSTQSLYNGLRHAASPFGSPLLSFLRFFVVGMGKTVAVPEGVVSEGTREAAVSVPHHLGGFLEAVFVWSMGILVTLGIGLALCILLWYFGRWLLAERKGIERHTHSLSDFINLLRRYIMMALFSIRYMRVFQNEDEKCYFRYLLRWGRARGVTRRKSETPREYGTRLSVFYPAYSEYIHTIVEGFNECAYGENQTGDVVRQKALLYARRRLKWFPFRVDRQ